MTTCRLILSLALVALGFPDASGAQSSRWVPYLGGGLVVQRHRGSALATAIGPTLHVGLARRLSPAIRLRADLRYSFDQSRSATPTAPCPGPCPADAIVATDVGSLATGLELYPSGTGRGVLVRVHTGLHYFGTAASADAGLHPSVGAGLGMRLPLGLRAALLLEARFDSVLRVARGPQQLWPVLLSLEF